MKFRVDEYDSSYVMHCKSQEQADIFITYLNDLGMCWNSGRPYMNDSRWSDESGGTCYRFRMGVMSCYNNYYRDPCIKILKFDDFDWGEEYSVVNQRISFEEAMGY